MSGIQCEDELVQNIHNPVFNSIQDGGVAKKPPTPYQFFLCNFWKRKN